MPGILSELSMDECVRCEALLVGDDWEMVKIGWREAPACSDCAETGTLRVIL